MPLTRVRALLIAALLAGAAPNGASAAPPAHERPVAGCQTVADSRGDSVDADLDITGLTFRTVSNALLAYVKVANLADGPAVGDGHRFTVSFTYRSSVVTMAGSDYRNGTGFVRDTVAESNATGGRTQLSVTRSSGTIHVDSGLRVTFDEARDWVVMELPDLDAQMRGFDGTITDAYATSAVDGYAVEAGGDSTPKTSWAVGDNRCFNVPTRIGFTVAKFPARRNVTATLTSAYGPVAGQPVTFYVNGRRYSTLTTASNGAATLTNVKPGSKVTAQFLSIGGYLGTTATTKV